MSRARIAVVSRDPRLRLRAAQVFDAAPTHWHVSLFESPPADADVVVRTSDVDGDGLLLDLDDPEDSLRRIEEVHRLARQGQVVEVFSPSGGTGCTTVALHLAAFLSTSVPCLYVEASSACGAIYRLGLDEPVRSWSDVVDDDSLSLAALPVAGGLRCLFASDSASVLPFQVLDPARALFPFVVVDRGSVVEDLEEQAIKVMVLQPSVPSVRRAAPLLDAHPSGCELVSNRLGPGSEMPDVALETILGRRFTLTLPCSPLLRDAEDEGRLLQRSAGAWSRRLARLARALQT